MKLNAIRETFRFWPEENLLNLLWHIREGTEILCGSSATLYYIPDGGL